LHGKGYIFIQQALSNPQYSEKSMEELRELSWKHAEGLKRDTRHYLEGNYPQSD
jgi:hypothetical protein